MNSRDDDYLENDRDDERPDSLASNASPSQNQKFANPAFSRAEPEVYSVGREVLMLDETTREATAIVKRDPMSEAPSDQHRPSIRLAAGTFEYELSASDVGMSSPLLLEVESVVMDSLLGSIVNNDAKDDNEDCDGRAPETSTLAAESAMLPFPRDTDAESRPIEPESDHNTKESSQTEEIDYGEGNGASLLLLIIVLSGSILLVTIVIGMAVAGAKLLGLEK